MKKIDEITIIGPGLIGSSLGLALKSKNIVNYYHRAKERRNFIDAYDSCFG